MAKPKLTYVGDAKVRALLDAYDCPVPLHAVRARFMGNIASPVLGASPLRSIESLWPGGLPTFESTNEANRLLQALMSLWNHLARHQKPTKPFRFANTEKLASLGELSGVIVMRCEEVDNFLEGSLMAKRNSRSPRRSPTSSISLRRFTGSSRRSGTC